MRSRSVFPGCCGFPVKTWWSANVHYAQKFCVGTLFQDLPETILRADHAVVDPYFYLTRQGVQKGWCTARDGDLAWHLNLFDEKKIWIFLIEVITSHGPMTPWVMELDEMLRCCDAGKVYITAFPDFAEFRRHSREIAWETEVWLAEIPDHMIHYNGNKFFGPH